MGVGGDPPPVTQRRCRVPGCLGNSVRVGGPYHSYAVRVFEGRLLITRFGPWSAEGCRLNAQGTYDEDVENDRRPPRYGVSVFGGRLRAEESRDDLIKRICSCVPVGGKKVAAIWADELEKKAWEVHPDMPPDMHYLIGQKNLAKPPDVESLERVWNEHKINNPAWKGK